MWCQPLDSWLVGRMKPDQATIQLRKGAGFHYVMIVIENKELFTLFYLFCSWHSAELCVMSQLVLEQQISTRYTQLRLSDRGSVWHIVRDSLAFVNIVVYCNISLTECYGSWHLTVADSCMHLMNNEASDYVSLKQGSAVADELAWRAASQQMTFKTATWPSPHPFRGWYVILLVALDIAYLCKKSDDSSFRYSWDMIGGLEISTGSCDMTMPISGMVCHLLAGTCYVQPSYQIWSFCDAATKIWKATQNLEIVTVWGGLGSLKVTGNVAIR